MSNCNIIVLRCDDKNDLKLLERLKQIEDKQKSYFLKLKNMVVEKINIFILYH
jgi:hypothetical protein